MWGYDGRAILVSWLTAYHFDLLNELSCPTLN